MAYKFSYQDNSMIHSRGERLNEPVAPGFKERLDSSVDLAEHVTIVGWRPDTGLYVIESMLNSGKKVHVVEIFKSNCLNLDCTAARAFKDKEAGPLLTSRLEIHNIDVQNFEMAIPESERGTLIWQDGPEHLEMDKSVKTIKKLQKTYNSIVISTPNGLHEQGALYGNEAERHLSAWHIEDYENLGFQCHVIGDHFLIGLWRREE